MKKKKVIGVAMFLSLSLMLAGCSDGSMKKVKGSGVASAAQYEAYDRLNERKKLSYYKPFSLTEKIDLPEEVQSLRVEVPVEKLPFDVDEQLGYVVAFKDGDGEEAYELQQSYVHYDEYEDIDQYYQISIVETDKNPLAKAELPAGKDLVGNEFTKRTLHKETMLYEQKLTTDSALNYTYYHYDEKEDIIETVATAANEFYTYYNGKIYHIGYSLDGEDFDEDMHESLAVLTKDILLQQ